MSKTKILFDATGDESWIGGVYYKKNVLFGLLNCDCFVARYEAVVVTNARLIGMFDCFKGSVELIALDCPNRRLKKLKICAIAARTHCKFIFHSFKDLPFPRVRAIAWIPDFQHKRFPKFFDRSSVMGRDLAYSKLAQSSVPLVLSSHDAERDYEEFYPGHRNSVHVVPFVSFIADEVGALDDDRVASAVEKFELSGKRFAFICNQFWKHKNHAVAFRAIQEADPRLPEDCCFVFTGKMEDYRNPDYIAKLKAMAETEAMKRRAVFLGFIERGDQLALMGAAEFIIQPSLFEGWGTVVEDSKVLDKTVLLSDIPVHREQKSDKCRLFDPSSSSGLADLIVSEFSKVHESDIGRGLVDAAERSSRYSEAFVSMLDGFS